MTLAETTTGTWTIDTAKTTVTATARMLSLADVPATFQVTSGSISIVDGALTAVEVVADATSYTSSISKRNKDVTTQKGLLDATTYPTITFTASGGSERQVSGEVTIKGTTVPLTFSISGLTIADTTATFEATTTLDRFSVGVNKSPAFVIGKDIEVRVSASATKN